MRYIDCCKSTRKNKKCTRKDGKHFSLQRRFSKKKCIKGPVRGFTMTSSCAPYKFCKNKTRKKQRGGSDPEEKTQLPNLQQSADILRSSLGIHRQGQNAMWENQVIRLALEGDERFTHLLGEEPLVAQKEQDPQDGGRVTRRKKQKGGERTPGNWIKYNEILPTDICIICNNSLMYPRSPGKTAYFMNCGCVAHTECLRDYCNENLDDLSCNAVIGEDLEGQIKCGLEISDSCIDVDEYLNAVGGEEHAFDDIPDILVNPSKYWRLAKDVGNAPFPGGARRSRRKNNRRKRGGMKRPELEALRLRIKNSAEKIENNRKNLGKLQTSPNTAYDKSFTKSNPEGEIEKALKAVIVSQGLKGLKGGKRQKKKTRKKNKKKQFLYNPNDPSKSFDVYIDKNPKDTIPIKYTTVKDVKDIIKKLERLYKTKKYPHKRIWQVGMIMKVRLEAMLKHKTKKYPNAKKVKQRFNLANKYFKFLGKRTKKKDFKSRRNLTFKF